MGKIIPSWTYKYDLDLNRKIYIELINKVFDSGRLLFGNELESFEKNFANYIGTTYAIGCDNATNAIFLRFIICFIELLQILHFFILFF